MEPSLTQAPTGDRATARLYAHNLVERVVVGDDEITIDVCAGAALAMKARSGSRPSRTPLIELATFVPLESGPDALGEHRPARPFSPHI